MDSSAVLAPVTGSVLVPAGAGAVVVHEPSARLHVLDAAGLALWESLDGRTDLRHVAALLARRFAAPPEVVQRDVLVAAAALLAAGAVELLPDTGSAQGVPRRSGEP
ncbi:MAG: hypothetical protein JWL64_1182 [Frankiales bacterium]|nr:hypothetical protein [Frankiales bacterium]